MELDNQWDMREFRECMLDKAQGAMIGLALGDALGTSLEFKPKDSYEPLVDMRGSGPFSLKAGQWTDDTSMMLCLAESLLAKGGHDPEDQMVRYCSWWKQGHNSVTGRCFDIGNTVVDALKRYQKEGCANAGSQDEFSAGNGSLMRLAPVPIFYSSFRQVSESEALKVASASSLTTHAERRAVESCQIMTWLLYQVFDCADRTLNKTELFEQLSMRWGSAEIHLDLQQVVRGSFLTKSREQIRGTGFVVDTLEAALWAFANSSNFKEGALLAANLGEDADTTAAIYGQLAGSYYGYNALPKDWLDKLAWHDRIKELATLLTIAPTHENLAGFNHAVLSWAVEERGESIYQALYQHQCILLDYRWMDYPHRHLLAIDLKEQSLGKATQKKALLKGLNYIECFQLITTVIRGDRFYDGLWRKFVEDGSLSVWLERVRLLSGLAR